MRNLIFVLFALFLTSCATSKGTASAGEAGAGDHVCGADCACKHKDGAEKPEGHVCGPDCGCDHGAKAASYHGGEHPTVEHTMENVAEHVNMLFGKLDADGNEALTREEVGEHHLSKRFDDADADGNGSISKAEMTAFGEKMHAHMAEKKAAAAAEAVEDAAGSAEATE